VTFEDVMGALESLADPRRAQAGARWGVPVHDRFGVPVPEIRRLARRVGTDHEMALELWRTGMAEARILACLVADPARVTADQLARWARQLKSWDVCDAFASFLVRPSPMAATAARDWPAREEEFVKRAGYVVIASLAVHDKAASDAVFRRLLQVVVRHARDERNFVRKAVSWAIRQIGKRNFALNREAIAAARKLAGSPSAGARWAASDALRELRSEAVSRRLRARGRSAQRQG
jgi:3-methyladenine DNA glycosylase AlkD